MTVTLDGGGRVSALLDAPPHPLAGCVLAHGAGAGMAHEFMAALAGGLALRGVAALRFQFPFMEAERRRPDPPSVAHAAVRAAVQAAATRWPGVPLFAGGKSYGARMASQAQAIEPLPGVRGLVFAGFPLHPTGKPSTARAQHLQQVQAPMLFLQGTRDALADLDLDLVRRATDSLGARATLHVVDGADHSFHVLVRSGRTDAQVREELLDTMARWMQAQLGRDRVRSG
ncbi:alpha/beta family hydrolase [Ramlibacter sp.]|uniref:alpha/beta hydrolase family protein n=1 Tax=Ramlibacter sp. TaxID=1917967 RepID=UPI002C1D7912|nr:alpha/beta family hydrolase [Ramlibacter sp.]HWI81891.1 alpha/beta family hydrolase [Ramlibacter sp.]